MILSDKLKDDSDFFVSALGGGEILREKRFRAIIFAAALCFLLAAPLFAAFDEGSHQSPDVFTVSSTGDYPTINGEALFPLHIVVPLGSSLAVEIVNVISDSLHDVGIEGVVHPVLFDPVLRGLYPENYGVDQYGFERPSPPGPPEIVTVYDPRDIHFQHTEYESKGVMWCGLDDSGLATPPGYGNNWDDRLTKNFLLPVGTVGLSYSIQYDTEPDWDFVFVEISADDGNSWVPLVSYDGFSDINGDWSPDFIYEEVDLSHYNGQEVQIRFRFESDAGWSDEDGIWDTDGACRIDWVQVSVDGDIINDDDFETGDDGWVASAGPPIEITVMQGYDIAFLASYFPNNVYGRWEEFGYSHSDSTYNQGYFNLEYDALYDELTSLPIDWNANFPYPPDLSGSDGIRAIEILQELQAIWEEDQPTFVLNNRILWEGGGDTVFPFSPMNFNNEHLAIPEVRQAINFAIDRQAIIDLYALNGFGPPWELVAVDSWIAPWHPCFDPVSYAEYDILAARQLLYEAGYTSVIVPDSIIDNVEEYVSSGILKAGAEKSLTKKLVSAIDLMDKGKLHAASQKLGDFIDQVNALVRSGKLPVEYGEELIAMAQDVIDLLGGS
ncbi:MAG: ABC transporter substrate-binding protein [Candidatus Thorarchaeota archaeon]